MRVVPITRLSMALALTGLVWGPLTAATTPKVDFTDTRLANGLRVIIAPDHHAPVFSIAVNYDVGSRNERPGRTGFAHLFEHMMFKGSANVGAFEHPLLVFNNGGNMNGTTNKDRTLYFETLPSNQLDLALFLEADRMRALDITRENLDNQRNAVQEERRLGLDNQPYGRTSEVLEELAYDNFAYEHSVIGSMQDLNAASVEDVAAFFKTYYAPNNAVLALAGDLEPASTLAKVRKYFESIPRQPAPPAVDLTEPRQTAERRQALDDALARLTRLDIVYKVPPSLAPDDDAVSVLSTVLATGRSSRLFESVVRQRQLAPQINAGKGESRGTGLLRIVAPLSPGQNVAALEAAIDAEIEKARSAARRNLVASLDSSLQRAILLSQYAMFYDNPGLINTRADRIAAVTAADVQRVARQYLVADNRTIVITNPKPAAAGGGR